MADRAKLGDNVVVTWLDAWCDQAETTEEDWHDDCPVTTFGRLVRRTPRVVSVAGEVLRNGKEYRAVTHVPAGMVVSVRRASGSERL